MLDVPHRVDGVGVGLQGLAGIFVPGEVTRRLDLSGLRELDFFAGVHLSEGVLAHDAGGGARVRGGDVAEDGGSAGESPGGEGDGVFDRRFVLDMGGVRRWVRLERRWQDGYLGDAPASILTNDVVAHVRLHRWIVYRRVHHDGPTGQIL